MVELRFAIFVVVVALVEVWEIAILLWFLFHVPFL